MDIVGRTLLGKYRIEGLLGQGGMGSVWKGTHLVTGRKVAIKILDERFLSNVNVVQRFGREARAASAVQHEGIVEVLDLDQTEQGLPFLVMEFLDGETLTKRIERKGRLSQEDTIRIGTLLLEALAAAHEHGVVHRDLKPDNIFLVPSGRRGEVLKILDFGISHKDDEAQAKLTMTGSVLGTPHYMSPEQAMGETNLDRRVDIYGAGVVLYECVVGDVPFDAPNYNKLLRVILDEEPKPPTQRGALIEPKLERVILSAIHKDRDKRPQTVRELLGALKASVLDETERFGPDAIAKLHDVGARADSRDRKRTASASFARPKDPSAISSTAMPAQRAPASSSASASGPQAGVSGVRGRGGGPLPPEQAVASGGLDLDAPIGHLDSPNIAPPAPAPARPALRLDAPTGTSGLGGMDELDALAPRAGLSLEIDESALARHSKPPPDAAGSATASGRHRAISERTMQAVRSAPPRSTPARTTPVGTAPGTRAASSGSTQIPPTEDEPAAPPKPTLRDRWDALPEPVRRWGPLTVASVIAFVVIVSVVRTIASPHDDAPGALDPAADDASTEDPTRPEWVLIEVDGVPPGATLRLDGLPGATLPLRVRRGGSHVLVIDAPGYQQRRLVFEAESSTHLRAEMRPTIGTGGHL